LHANATNTYQKPYQKKQLLQRPAGQFKLDDEGAVCGLAELIKKGLQVDAQGNH
jgi:hypothetical protein